jgi:hypothetical protein
MDPLGALAEFVLGKMKQSAIAQWAKLLFTMGFSATVSFLFVCGSVLALGQPVAFAIGSGMVMAAMAMVVLFRRSPLTKGLMVVLPEAEATKEIGSNFQIIEKAK